MPRRYRRSAGGGMATKVVNAVMRATKRAANREKFAYVRVPRDPAERVALFSEHSKALTAPGQLYSQGPTGMAARKALRWRGQGGYWSDLAKSAWDSSAGLRAQAGDWARSGAGGSLGLAAGHLSRYLGTGDYTVDNALVGAGMSSAGIPTFGPEMQTYRVQKTEFLRNVYAPPLGPGGTGGQFVNITLPLNPGLQQTFPWLALVAPQFEEYEFEQLMFYWRPMVSDFNSGTGQVGEIVMATQYNPSEPPFTDLSRAKNYMGAMSSKTSIPMNQGVECDPTKNSGAAGKYIRTGPIVGTNQDLKQYDLGNLNLMISGTPPQYASQVLGELWVAYTVHLRKPKLPDSSGAEILRDYFQSDGVTALNPSEAYGGLVALIQAPILSAAQNRLSGQVDIGQVIDFPDTGKRALYIDYTVPSWYTGALRLVGRALAVNCSNTQPMLPVLYAPQLTGQVTLNRDLTTVFPNGTVPWLGQYPAPITSGVTVDFAIAATAGGEVSNVSVTVDVTVAENTSGSDNKVRIFIYAVQSANDCQVGGWTLDVSEYNSSFNSPVTGNILLQDADSNAVPWPYK